MSILTNLLLRSASRFTLFALILSPHSPAVLAQSAMVLAPHKPISPKIAKSFPLPAPVLGSMRGGPWFVDADFKSAVYIKNGVETSPITIKPILYLSNGKSYTLPDVTLEAAGNAIIDVGRSLENLGVAPYATLSGYIELRYSWPWDPICATIRNVDVTHSLIFSYGLRSSKPLAPVAATESPSESGSNIIEGVWWKQEAKVTGFLALANTTSRTMTVMVDLTDDAGAGIAQHAVTIAPFGTKMLDLSELASTTNSVGGIRVTYTGAATDALINGGLEDANSGYSAAIPFAPAPSTRTRSTATVAELGLMTGQADPMMLFPSGTTFNPYTVLRNVSEAPMTAKPKIWWMAGGSARSFGLPAVTLSPLQSQTLDVPRLLAQAGLKGFSGNFNLVFAVEGDAQGLIVAGGSVDNTNTYVFGVTPHGISESASKSLSYWSIADGDDTMVTLWNPADEAGDFIFQLTYSRGHYDLPVHLEPRATRTFTVSELAKSGLPDANGNVIPADVLQGGAKIVGSLADNEEILLAMDAGTYNVRKGTCIVYCQTCNGVTAWSIADNPFVVSVAQQQQLTFYQTWNTGSQYDVTSSPSSWTTSNTAIATVGTPGSGTAGLVAGVSPGSPTITASYPYSVPLYTGDWCEGSSWSCPYQLTSGQSGSSGTVKPTVTISGPTAMALTGLIYLTATGNPSGGTFAWSASNPNVLLGTPSNATVAVSASSTGTYNITVTYKVGEVTVSASQEITILACPTTLELANSLLLPLAPEVPGILTGVGIIAEMQVGPSTINWDYTGGIIENVSAVPGANTCPATFGSCNGDSDFEVGLNDDNHNMVDGVPTPPMTNVFYDNHTAISTTNLLSAAGITSCTSTCSQTYSCGGNQIGPTFQIKFSFTKGSVGSTPVTNVSVTKTAVN